MHLSKGLILAQADDVTGEVVGFAIGEMVAMGARNVQVISTISKKNRPGYVFLIDCPPDRRADIGIFLARELGIAGYHLIKTEHVELGVDYIPKIVEVLGANRSIRESFVAKRVGPADHPNGIKVEHDFLAHVKRRIHQELGITISLAKLRASIEAQLSTETGQEIVLRLDQRETCGG